MTLDPRRQALRLRDLAVRLRASARPDPAALRSLELLARQQQAADGDWDEDCGMLAMALDAILDAALEAFQAGEADQGIALSVGAAATSDALLEAMGLPDADEPDEGGDPSAGAPMAGAYSASAHGHFTRAAVDNSAWDGSAALSACASSSTPGSCYGAVCAGRKAGPAAKQSSWALPHHKTPDSPPNAAAVRNGLARLAQTQGLTNAAAARRHLEAHLAAINGGQSAAEHSHDEEREVPFPMAASADGLNLEGYALVFNSPTRIEGWDGEFDEQIDPAAVTRTLAEQMPVLMFEHGRHPLIGSMPLGVTRTATPDAKGLYTRSRLSDNWLIQPVRDAVRDGAVTGMSFRFSVPAGGDEWTQRKGDVPLRTLKDIDIREWGPVVFPAYAPTTATVRSALDCIDCDTTGRPGARSAGGGDLLRERLGNAVATLPSDVQARHRELLLRGIIR